MLALFLFAGAVVAAVAEAEASLQQDLLLMVKEHVVEDGYGPLLPLVSQWMVTD